MLDQNNKAILIVEDDIDIRESLRQFLEMENFQVFTAENGREGLALLHTGKPCLILLDMFMPIMTGAEFLEKLTLENPKFSDESPVVIMSAAPPDGEMVRSVRKLASEYIKKPVDLDHLLRVIQKHTPPVRAA